MHVRGYDLRPRDRVERRRLIVDRHVQRHNVERQRTRNGVARRPRNADRIGPERVSVDVEVRVGQTLRNRHRIRAGHDAAPRVREHDGEAVGPHIRNLHVTGVLEPPTDDDLLGIPERVAQRRAAHIYLERVGPVPGGRDHDPR